MKNRYKLFIVSIISFILATSCSSKLNKYSIYFSGVGAIFLREVDFIYPKNDYSIGVCAIDNYVISEDDFTVKVNGVKTEPGNSTWRMSNNLLTIKSDIITNNIDVSVVARPKELELNIINPDPRITFTDDKPFSGEDFNLHMNFDSIYGIRVKKIQVGKFFEFSNYTLRKEGENNDKNNYVFSIDQKYLNGNINVEFELVENYVTISNNLLELSPYDSGAVKYFLPNNQREYDITAEIDATSQIKNCLKCTIDKEYNIINVDVIKSFGNTDAKAKLIIKDKISGETLNVVLINLMNPKNVQNALEATVLGCINHPLNKKGEAVTSTFNIYCQDMLLYTCDEWDKLMEIYGRCGSLYFKGKKDSDLLSNDQTFGCYEIENFAAKETTLEKTDENYLENLTNINYLNHKAENINNGGRPCYIENIYRRLIVRNSDELFWAVEHGYRPEFTDSESSKKAEVIYENAKEICRSLTDDKMNKLQIARIFFEYLNKEIHYDYNLVEARKEPDYKWYEHQGNFLESAFLEHKMYASVNEGLSKSFAFMCGIVGIPCFRTYGLNKTHQFHSYNYVKVQGIWYLVCPTWCRIETSIEEVVKMYGSKVSLLDYTSFLSSKYYFTDYSAEYNYSDLLWQNETRSKRNFSDAPITSLDFTVDDRTFYLQSTEDAYALKTVIDKNADIGTFVCLSYPTRYDAQSNEWNKIITSDYKGVYQIYHSYGEIFTQEWILFN